jgi:hypothetical protein
MVLSEATKTIGSPRALPAIMRFKELQDHSIQKPAKSVEQTEHCHTALISSTRET